MSLRSTALKATAALALLADEARDLSQDERRTLDAARHIAQRLADDWPRR